MELNPTLCKCTNMEKHKVFWGMILFIVDLFANVKRFDFYAKLSSDHFNMRFCIFWIILDLI